MKLTITFTDNSMRVDCNGEKNFDFDLSQTVNLNEFVKYISDNEQAIESDPNTYEDFVEQVGDGALELKKLGEYVFKIVGAFNATFDAVYGEQLPECLQ